MHPIVKIIIGLILMAAAVYWVWKTPIYPETYLGIQQNTNLYDFIIVLNGAIPPMVFLLGLFIVWLEYDEWKKEKELKAEEEKMKRKARKRKKKK